MTAPHEHTVSKSSYPQKQTVHWRVTPYYTLACLLAGLMGPIDFSAAAEFEPRAVAITQATVVTAPGQQIENGRVILRDGLIVAVGADIPIPPDAEVIEVPGHMVYAGFIDAATPALLNPDQPAQPAPPAPLDVSRYALAATRIDNRKSLTPEFEAAEHLRLDNDTLEKRRQLGFTTLHIVPSGRLASGRGTLITTRGTTLRECLLQSSTMSQFRVFGPREEGYPHTLMGGTAHLRQIFLDARRYAQQQALFKVGAAQIPRPLQDAVLEGLQPVITHQMPVWFLANTRDEIERALNFAAEQELPLTLWGGREAERCLARLQEKQIQVILNLDYGDEPKVEVKPAPDKLTADLQDPIRALEDVRDRWRLQVAGPKALKAAGLKLAASSQGLNEPADFFKGLRQLIQAGLPRDAALAAITSEAAAILGQEHRLGSLTPGKLGHVVVLTGPFDDERSQVRFLFVDGKKFEYKKEALPVPKDSGSPGLELAAHWKLDIEAADGPVHCDLVLIQTGTRLNGSFKSPQGDGKLTSGKVETDKAEWVVSIGAGDREIELKFSTQGPTGTPPQLKGILKSAFGAQTNFTAQRETAPPQQPNAVAINGIEDDDSKPTPATPAGITDLPVELDADRLKRTLPTGGTVFIQKATLLNGKGETLPETSLFIKAGKIAAIGKDLTPEAGVVVIDATGKFAMPGIIDTHSHIMIGDGLDSVNEATLSIVPEVRVKDAVSTTDITAYRALAG
ncbi:MAG: hypothetical protein V4719_15230, partial [Planctomycetota bacterium]